jgi:hypothetical protein
MAADCAYPAVRTIQLVCPKLFPDPVRLFQNENSFSQENLIRCSQKWAQIYFQDSQMSTIRSAVFRSRPAVSKLEQLPLPDRQLPSSQ